MKIWLITDTHFGHAKMIEYCGRPKGFEWLILTALNKAVRAGDLLIHLGDFCIGKDEDWHREYFRVVGAGKNWLLKGNHDKKSNSWYLSHGWDWVGAKFQDKFFGKTILFSHVPKANIFGASQYDINIHGHFHNNLHRLLEGKYVVDGEEKRNKKDLAVLTKKHKLLAVEEANYQPVSLEKFINTN